MMREFPRGCVPPAKQPAIRLLGSIVFLRFDPLPTRIRFDQLGDGSTVVCALPLVTEEIPPVQKSLNGSPWNCRPSRTLGKADVTGEETGKCTLSATVVGAQASEERFAEITPGKA